VADPLTRLTVPTAVPLTLKVTVPVGVPLPGLAALTLAVKVTAWHSADGLADAVTFVPEVALLTVIGYELDVALAKLLSPG